VTLKLHGIAELAAKEPVLAQRTLDRLRTMLGDLAFKRNLRLWIWSSDTEARAIAGLTSNPGRAAADAAWAALDTHEVIAGLVEDLPIPIRASIGIVRGIASGQRDPQGNLVRYTLNDPAGYLADVLAASVPASATWVAGGVYRLVRKDFLWGDAPTLELEKRQGAPNQMRIYSLVRSLSRDERVAAAQGAPTDLVGRDAEKADLHSAFHQSASGSGKVVFRAIVGELGIGKSALVSAFVAELPPNARIVRAECTPVRQEVPFSMVGDLVRAIVGITGEEPFEQVAKQIASAGGGAASGDSTNPMVARLAELATGRQMGGGDDEDATYRRRLVTSGIRNVLASVAIESPVVLVIEGLQWADAQSLELLGDLMKLSDPLPILLILVTRPDDQSTRLLEGVMRIELHGLSTEEQIRLVETRLGVTEGVRQVCADILPRVGGNPFFLLEMVDALLERGALEIREVTREGGESVHVLVRTEKSESRLPSTLEQLLADRIQELPPEEKNIVDWLAIAAGPLQVADLEKLTTEGSLAGGANDAIGRLCARGLVDRKGEIVDFRHPLTRDVAYVALEPQARIGMHRALGNLLADTHLARGLSAAIVARHLARGEDGARASEFYVEAGNAARSSYQTQLAIRYYRRALGLLADDDPRQLGVHEALESIYRMLGRRRERMVHLDGMRKTARAIGTPRAACLALVRTARFDYDEGHLQRGLPIARRAAEIAHAATLVQQEIETEALVSELLRELGDIQGALAACDRALASSDPKVNPQVPARVRAEVLRLRGVLLRRVGRVSEAMQAHAEAIAVFKRVGARRQEARAKNSLAFAMFVQGRYEDAIALALEAIQIDLSIGGRFQIANTLANIGAAYSKLGDLPRAQAYLDRARTTHERYGDQDNRADTLLMSAELMLEENKLDEADVFLRDAAALNQATDNAYSTTHERIVQALIERQRRNAKRAVEAAYAARRAAEDMALVSFHFYSMAIEAAARVDAGEMHTGTLLATTALGAVDTLQGCEYGLEVRVLCADALKRAGSPQAALARQRAIDHAQDLLKSVRDPRLRRLFVGRAAVAGLFETTPVPVSQDNISRTESAVLSSGLLIDSSIAPRSVKPT
jgi:tetratricopeptide (TPR) repeat protein